MFQMQTVKCTEKLITYTRFQRQLGFQNIRYWLISGLYRKATLFCPPKHPTKMTLTTERQCKKEAVKSTNLKSQFIFLDITILNIILALHRLLGGAAEMSPTIPL